MNKLKSINKKQTFKPLKKQFEALRSKNGNRGDYLKHYYNTNETILKEKGKAYRQANREKINEKITCECGRSYMARHKSRHEKSEAHLNFINKTVKIEKKGTDRITCECGIIYPRSNKNIHMKSKKHLAYQN